MASLDWGALFAVCLYMYSVVSWLACRAWGALFISWLPLLVVADRASESCTTYSVAYLGVRNCFFFFSFSFTLLSPEHASSCIRSQSVRNLPSPWTAEPTSAFAQVADNHSAAVISLEVQCIPHFSRKGQVCFIHR